MGLGRPSSLSLGCGFGEQEVLKFGPMSDSSQAELKH